MDAKRWWTSKTIWFNVLVFIIAVANQFGFNQFEPDPQVATYATLFVGLVNILLRLVTNRAVK